MRLFDILYDFILNYLTMTPFKNGSRAYQWQLIIDPLYCRYFLFYRQVAEMLQQHMSRTEIASPSVAVTVSQMWNDMSSDDKETLATLAALEGSQDSNSSSGLSDDLQELDVKPLDSSHFIDGTYFI